MASFPCIPTAFPHPECPLSFIVPATPTLTIIVDLTLSCLSFHQVQSKSLLRQTSLNIPTTPTSASSPNTPKLIRESGKDRQSFKEALSVLMLWAPVFIFTSSSSALLGHACCGLSIRLSLLAVFSTLVWVYGNS